MKPTDHLNVNTRKEEEEEVKAVTGDCSAPSEITTLKL